MKYLKFKHIQVHLKYLTLVYFSDYYLLNDKSELINHINEMINNIGFNLDWNEIMKLSIKYDNIELMELAFKNNPNQTEWNKFLFSTINHMNKTINQSHQQINQLTKQNIQMNQQIAELNQLVKELIMKSTG